MMTLVCIAAFIIRKQIDSISSVFQHMMTLLRIEEFNYNLLARVCVRLSVYDIESNMYEHRSGKSYQNIYK